MVLYIQHIYYRYLCWILSHPI